MDNPSWKGARSEAHVLAALVASGRTVLMPWGGSERYDFVVHEADGSFVRIQCKTGNYHHGAVWFRTCSADRRRPSGDVYQGQVDAFAVYCPELQESYLVPIADIPAKQLAALRVVAPGNCQMAGIRWAKTYTLAVQNGEHRVKSCRKPAPTGGS